MLPLSLLSPSFHDGMATASTQRRAAAVGMQSERMESELRQRRVDPVEPHQVTP
jgi:hypothetical protein